MTDTLKIYLAQINSKVGALSHNLALIAQAYQTATAQHADLVLLPELALTGYSPEDLVLSPSFQREVTQSVEALYKLTQSSDTGILLSLPWVCDQTLYNGYMLIYQGECLALRYKYHLPNYGVFDEARTFNQPSKLPEPILFKGVSLGVMICEDMWTARVSAYLHHQGAQILIVLNASPFELQKSDRRRALAKQRVAETGLPLVYLNLIGGQDEVVFDGASFVLDASGHNVGHLKSFETDGVLSSWGLSDVHLVCRMPKSVSTSSCLWTQIYQAMVLGLRDYVEKNGFPGVLLGLSGGIDSALTAAVAVDALGSNRVRCVMLPSVYTSSSSLEDAQICATLLGVHYDVINIHPAVLAFDEMLSPHFENHPVDATEENIQARARGTTLMALSNKTGWLLLTTGNKSEVAIGYYTLYGDACGGYSVLKDLYKTQVFAISRWRNEQSKPPGLGPQGSVMPETILTKAPSAELKPEQTDQDTLPPYEILDDILHQLIEEDRGAHEIASQGYDLGMIKKIEHLLYCSEHKRRQSAPGVKLSKKHFGRDRRYPLTNAFRTHLITY